MACERRCFHSLGLRPLGPLGLWSAQGTIPLAFSQIDRLSHNETVCPTPQGRKKDMSHTYKITKHPLTDKFEKAAWLHVGRYYYVVFPDGRWYHEQYRAWECQEVCDTGTIEQIALMTGVVETVPAALSHKL
jgi:hypothetical protein